MYRLIAYAAVFLLLACTVTAVPAAIYGSSPAPPRQTESAASLPSAPTAAAAPTQAETVPPLPEVQEHGRAEKDVGFTPRMTAPDADDPCYYSEENIFYAADYGMPNCTCYAWGRAYELSGEMPRLSPYDACTWYAYNAENGCYDYGDTPEEGAIACWAYADGGPGHVAVVEQVEDDTVLLSNSAYSGEEFYLDTVPAADPSRGREGWIFQGYIYTGRKS